MTRAAYEMSHNKGAKSIAAGLRRTSGTSNDFVFQDQNIVDRVTQRNSSAGDLQPLRPPPKNYNIVVFIHDLMRFA